jgi:hypothetical protein
MKRNYSMMMKQLQMAYLGAKLEKQPEGERCPLCLELACNHGVDVQNDPFLSLTTMSEFKIS